jgi:hypothetical protein
VHDSLDHEGYLCRRIELRQLLDLALIRTRHEKAIDWTQLDRRFSAAGVGHVLAANLRVAERLFGQPVPRIVRLSERRRWARDIARMPGLYVAARRRDPWGVFNLLRPKTWPGKIRRIRTTLGMGASQPLGKAGSNPEIARPLGVRPAKGDVGH